MKGDNGVGREAGEIACQGTCIKYPWIKIMGQGTIECGKWVVGRATESNGRKMGATVFEKQ